MGGRQRSSDKNFDRISAHQLPNSFVRLVKNDLGTKKSQFSFEDNENQRAYTLDPKAVQ
jgi:hypothetical protein